MNYLFVHQSVPGQYRHIVRALSSLPNHRIIGLGIYEASEYIPPNVQYVRYPLTRGNTLDLHPWLIDLDSKLIRGEACASAALSLKQSGFTPDIICAHPGWGEALFLKHIWPHVPILSYQEFFYNSTGFDSGFDPEFDNTNDSKDGPRILLKNANPLLMLHQSDWNVTPTNFQKSSFPSIYHSKFSVIHDGVDTNNASPTSAFDHLTLPSGFILSNKTPIITFVNRRIEPYRGCHTFIRSIPKLLKDNPAANIVVVGETEGVSYGSAPPNGSWLTYFLAEIDGQYDQSRLHFTGPLDFSLFIRLLQISSCHVYLTYPFVLSWSLMEAMSCSLPVVASSTAPVAEVLQHDHNGLLIDFFSPDQLSAAVNRILSDSSLSIRLGINARKTVLDRYSLQTCVPQHISLINLVASGSMPL